jgi:hypothetical protein
VGLALPHLVGLALGAGDRQARETAVAWDRAGFRRFWTWKVRHGRLRAVDRGPIELGRTIATLAIWSKRG